MKSRIILWLLALALAGTGIWMTWYKHTHFGFPLTRGAQSVVWTIEAEIQFDPGNAPVMASFALPDEVPGFSVLDESFASSGYGFSISMDRGQRRAVWAKQSAEGQQSLYARLVFVREPGWRSARILVGDDWPVPAQVPFLDGSALHAAEAIVQAAVARSASAETLATELARILFEPDSNQNVRMLLRSDDSREQRAEVYMGLLSRAGVPARIVRGIFLQDGRRSQTLIPMVDIFADGSWILVDPMTGELGLPEDFLVWQRGGRSMLDVEGGHNSQVRFSAMMDTRSAALVARGRAEDQSSGMLDFSIYALPIGEQNVFRYLLLVPLGALVLVVMRNIVGISTAGTFMPVLIALAFLETRLLPGILLFVIVVGLGLSIRFLLSELNLLLVPRISAVVIVVIMLMAGLSLLSIKLDLQTGLAVTFFPMIILAWTIERLSIVWEEEGSREAMLQGGGSLLVAVLAYLVMMSSQLRHLIFTFPELLLVILAIVLLIGKYTGYRLSELWRFRKLGGD